MIYLCSLYRWQNLENMDDVWAHILLYFPPALTFRSYILPSESVSYDPRKKQAVPCDSIDRLVLVMENTSAYCEVGTKFVYIL
jgi:hypothetical protein